MRTCSFDKQPSVAGLLLISPASGETRLCIECLAKISKALGVTVRQLTNGQLSDPIDQAPDD